MPEEWKFNQYSTIERRSGLKRGGRIRYKCRVKKEYWRTGQILEDAEGMAKLRSRAYHRSGGICECGTIPANRRQCCGPEGCGKHVTWQDGHLHHLVSHPKGGSDIDSNVRFIRRECHDVITGKLHWTPLLPELHFLAKKPSQSVKLESEMKVNKGE